MESMDESLRYTHTHIRALNITYWSLILTRLMLFHLFNSTTLSCLGWTVKISAHFHSKINILHIYSPTQAAYYRGKKQHSTLSHTLRKFHELIPFWRGMPQFWNHKTTQQMKHWPHDALLALNKSRSTHAEVYIEDIFQYLCKHCVIALIRGGRSHSFNYGINSAGKTHRATFKQTHTKKGEVSIIGAGLRWSQG